MYGRRRTRPSLLILIVFAAVAGVIYFVMDNTPPSGTNDVSSTSIAAGNLTIITEGTPSDTGSAQATADAGIEATTEITQEVAEETAEPSDAQQGIDNVVQDTEVTTYANLIPPDTALFIPSAGIYAPIVETYLDGVSWDVSQLGTNVGHLQGTAWIDTPGNVVLSGHVELTDGRQGVFANLGEAAIGDIVVIVMNGDEWRYVITEIGSTTPDDLTPIYPTTEERLTLITCEDYDFISNSYLERTIIVAQRIT